MEVYKREHPPAHYSLKVEGFSLLSKTKVEKHESGIFEAGGHKWSLCLYPDGDKNFDGQGHVSLYLVIEGTDELNHGSHGWEVNVNFRLFVLDQKRNMYLTIQDPNGVVRKFHELKREWGFPRLISLDTLRDASNGYLVDDSCIFGAEVFVMKPLGRCDSLAMTKAVPSWNKYTWRLGHYFEMNASYYYSPPFNLGGRTWKMIIYPKGDNRAYGKSVSLYLNLVGADDLPPKGKLHVQFKLRVLDQLNNNHRERKTTHCWLSSSTTAWGHPEMLSLEELHNPVKGFAYKGAVKVEAEILQICEFTVRDGTSKPKWRPWWR